jgi:ABC-type multidrug transport system ATPase subunit
VNLQIKLGELFTILGQNGAGKSTLINVLSGRFTASKGSAQIMGYDIKEDADKVEEFIGLCPQHDILWEDLTAYEHLEIYAKIRSKIYNLIIIKRN